mgnify:CR=1 FL=1
MCLHGDFYGYLLIYIIFSCVLLLLLSLLCFIYESVRNLCQGGLKKQIDIELLRKKLYKNNNMEVEYDLQ